MDFTKKEEIILDGQSKICNWLYNQLLDACRKDYLENNNTLELLKGRNLRNYGVSLKKEYPFLNSVFSSVLKEPSARLKRAYEGFFKSGRGYPKFRSWKKKWFSLVFDEPNKGWGLQNDGNSLLISLGNIPDMPVKKGRRNPAVIGKLKEPLQLIEGELLKTLTICKQQGVFYAVFSIEKCSVEELEHKQKMSDYRKICNKIKKENKTLDENMQIPLPTKPVLKEKKVEIPEEVKWISLDPNHKNFFVGVDDIGDSIEFDKLQEIKYWDKKIDKLKSFRDRCQKKYRKRETKHGNKYVVHSPRWNRFNRALDKAYHCRREQIKTALFTIAHELYRHYDLVIIGDYTPTNGTARFKNTKRSMLNQEKIGEFRLVLKWVASKLRKYYIKANEHHTTKECCVCGHLKKKEPNIRIFKCVSCGTRLMRDNNSSVNIAKKVNFLLDIQKYKDKLITFTFKGEYRYGQKVSIIKNKL
ncbi:RNA-guided endonuclease TnpB family protein [Oceanobacillus sp. Castelsardo]|uniref:RNA-guided endonuclease InsQ/TnpB family protein n=1 Tax=Oceanobacillus sp. Castelsardo TaxID=1851204 RepID=UPI0012E79207|nr:RNA-guided endonuclease TnpB family protein [Oceanobacillus sp. Castelsardo]